MCTARYPSMQCRWYPSIPCSRSPGGWYPSMPCRFPGPHQGGKLRGIWLRGVSRPTTKGDVEEDLVSGVSPGPHPGGYLLQKGGLCSRGGVETPPVTATAAGGTHPTGMHSCLSIGLIQIHTDTQWIYLTHKSYIWCLPTERSRKHIEVEGFYCVPKKANKIVTVIMSTDYFDVDKWVTLGPACNEICYNGHSTPVTTSRFFCKKITDNDVLLQWAVCFAYFTCWKRDSLYFDEISRKKSLTRGHVIFLLWSWDTSHEQRNTFDIIDIIILTHKYNTSVKVLFA